MYCIDPLHVDAAGQVGVRRSGIDVACAPCRFNKRRDEFGSKREYDDYLEMRETYSAPQGIAGAREACRNWVHKCLCRHHCACLHDTPPLRPALSCGLMAESGASMHWCARTACMLGQTPVLPQHMHFHNTAAPRIHSRKDLEDYSKMIHVQSSTWPWARTWLRQRARLPSTSA